MSNLFARSKSRSSGCACCIEITPIVCIHLVIRNIRNGGWVKMLSESICSMELDETEIVFFRFSIALVWNVCCIHSGMWNLNWITTTMVRVLQRLRHKSSPSISLRIHLLEKLNDSEFLCPCIVGLGESIIFWANPKKWQRRSSEEAAKKWINKNCIKSTPSTGRRVISRMALIHWSV